MTDMTQNYSRELDRTPPEMFLIIKLTTLT